jgi:hypothetical protein
MILRQEVNDEEQPVTTIVFSCNVRNKGNVERPPSRTHLATDRPLPHHHIYFLHVLVKQGVAKILRCTNSQGSFSKRKDPEKIQEKEPSQ